MDVTSVGAAGSAAPLDSKSQILLKLLDIDEDQLLSAEEVTEAVLGPGNGNGNGPGSGVGNGNGLDNGNGLSLALGLGRQPAPLPDASDLAAMQWQAGIRVTQVQGESLRVEIGPDGIRAEFTRFEAVQVEAGFSVSAAGQQPKRKDPLLVDLDGNGFETSGLEEGAAFDVTGTGEATRSSTATGGDAWLVMDRDGNGRIDDGSELFGDQHGAADGIAELTKFDDNNDGRIDASDLAWGRLGLWQDTNRDGSSAGEMRSLADAGFSAIDLSRLAYQGTTTGGDPLSGAVRFERTDGSHALAADAWVAYA